MTPPRVLLVEDDASVRRFVTTALDDIPIEIIQRDTLRGAIECLFSEAPVDLVLTDLRLADGSALNLVEWLTVHRNCRVAVFSAGMTADIKARLKKMGVWRILDKPVSLSALYTCVTQGTEPSPLMDMSRQPATSPSTVDAYFAGDKALYGSYVNSCLSNFPADVKACEQALAENDLNSLKRCAQSLKTVLNMIGQEEHALTARMLEQSAANGEWLNSKRFWLLLQPVLCGA